MLETMCKKIKLLSLNGDESPGMSILPDELIWEILLRLPMRLLLQFKCVCKSWKTIISHPQFAIEHLRASNANPNMPHQRLVCPTACYTKILSFSVQSLFQNPSNPTKPLVFTMMGDSYTILGSCNGLLCLCDSLQRYVKLWNPSIGLTSKTMLSTGISHHEKITHWGFGYDHVNDKYKLLLVVKDRDHETKIVTKIYTFGSNSCRVIQNFQLHPAWWLGKFVNGTLNWLSMRCNQWVILSFDLGTETWGEVLLPNGDTESICIPVLDVLRDCLCVAFFDPKNVQWIVWLMKDFGVQDSWTILTMIPQDFYDVRSHLIRPCLRPDLLCISEDGVVMFRPTRSKVVLFNSNNGRWDYPRISIMYGWHRINAIYGWHIYYESLVSPP